MKSFNIFPFLIIFYSTLSFGQEKQWFAMTQGRYLTRAKYTDVDKHGNCYVLGDSKGESSFESDKSTAVPPINRNTSIHWAHTFLVKYSPLGEVIYVMNFKPLGANFHFASPRGIKCLRNGDVLIMLYSDNDMRVSTGKKTFDLKAGNKTKLIRLDSNGNLVWDLGMRPRPNSIILEDLKEHLYIYKEKYYGQPKTLVKLDKQGNEIGNIPLDTLAYSGAKIIGNKLWVYGMYRKKKRFPGDQLRGNISLHSINLRNYKTKQHFKLFFDDLVRQQVDLGVFRAKPELNIWTKSKKTKSSVLTKYKKNGKVFGQLETPDLYHYNSTIYGGKKGELFMKMVGTDSISWNDSIIRTEKHKMFINELYWAKLDHKLNLKWLIPGGGTASNHHSSKLSYRDDDIFLVSDLLDYGTFFGERIALKWKSGFYVLKVKQ